MGKSDYVINIMRLDLVSFDQFLYSKKTMFLHQHQICSVQLYEKVKIGSSEYLPTSELDSSIQLNT